ncbi:MAG: hypothetical protein WC441_05335 [Patescibacteria group bacterium]
MSSIIDLRQKREELALTATAWHNLIHNQPPKIRAKDESETGIQVFVGLPDTNNFAFFPVGQPTGDISFAAANRAVYSWLFRDMLSLDNDGPITIGHSASLIVDIEGLRIQAAVAGLEYVENIFIGAMLIAKAVKITPAKIFDHLSFRHEKFPECFREVGHYLHPYVTSMRVEDTAPPNISVKR